MSGAASLSRLGLLRRLVRKELSEILRDRRTILTLVLMPLLLYPLLGVAFRTFLVSNMTPRGAPKYLIGVHPGGEGQSVMWYLHQGQKAIQERKTPDERTSEEASPEKPPPHEQPAPEIREQPCEDLEEEVSAGRVHVGIRVRPPGAFHPQNLARNLGVDWEILYAEDSSVGLEAVRYLETVCAAANVRFLSLRLRAFRVWQREVPVQPRPTMVRNSQPRKPALLPGLVPLILILMTITGAVYPAIDVTAGERERGTLEILAAAPVPRLDVLFAKYVAVFAVAMLTALVNLGTMTATLYLSGVGPMLFGAEGLTPLVFGQVLALLLLFAAFFSAVLLALTSFARSFKEAQAYLVPLMLLALMPGVLSLVPGLQLQGPLAIAPLINVALLTRDLLEGSAGAMTAVVVVTATLLYALAALALAARVFGAEAVLYSQPGGWADLFRRPRERSDAATPAAALLCAALLFPSSFVASALLAVLGGHSLTEALLGMAAANVLLFVGYPLVAAWWGRLRFSSALRLARPSWQAWAAALLLGLCLWPWVHELTLLMRALGFASLREGNLERVRDMLEQWRTLSPLLIVVAVAVVPAVVEELFFRGYLQSALLGVLRPRSAVLSSAALFALFHVILGSVLAVERFVPSLLLGVLLGWMCWRTGSVWPGMVLHALHNGCVALLGYYQPQLTELGWPMSETAHLPPVWLAAAMLGVVAGVAWVRYGASGGRQPPVAGSPGG
ncbi:MAG TPA: ABC transporter permease subunit/CPBP intramembrane protease [Gemmataceae bacterium]|jgi:ABC-2 type transport system permease protein/sodium transport system permease protein